MKLVLVLSEKIGAPMGTYSEVLGFCVIEGAGRVVEIEVTTELFGLVTCD